MEGLMLRRDIDADSRQRLNHSPNLCCTRNNDTKSVSQSIHESAAEAKRFLACPAIPTKPLHPSSFSWPSVSDLPHFNIPAPNARAQTTTSTILRWTICQSHKIWHILLRCFVYLWLHPWRCTDGASVLAWGGSWEWLLDGIFPGQEAEMKELCLLVSFIDPKSLWNGDGE